MENEAEKQIDLLFLGFLIEELVVAAGRITWIGKSIFPYCKTLTGKTISIEVESNVKANKNPAGWIENDAIEMLKMQIFGILRFRAFYVRPDYL
ncbi:hypothetical protein MRB53_011278 [Persea americana]|uniref:Uncharacterized protein n=1 Tax=Persea americana TaxID=3435 RepID=A0ACC2LV98_PERAE|nr:hypothetical protein MRB53_011278 [Persea americana]